MIQLDPLGDKPNPKLDRTARPQKIVLAVIVIAIAVLVATLVLLLALR